MYKCSHFMLIVVSGLIWTLIGIMLMTLGMHHMMDALRFWDEMIISSNFSFFKSLSVVFEKPQQAMTALIGLCLVVGYLKGQYVLLKTVKSGVKNILSFPNPAEIKNLYGKKYYFILAAMFLLGFTLRRLHLPGDVHGAIDLAIGSALLKGAISYYKYAWAEKRGTLVCDNW